jgi:hypothetical protein
VLLGEADPTGLVASATPAENPLPPCQLPYELIEHLEKLEKLREQVARENAEEQHKIALEEYEIWEE